MVAMGRIEPKKNYEMEILDENKVVSFVENYSLNMIERVNVILEIVHHKIQELKSQEELSKSQILENQEEENESGLWQSVLINDEIEDRYTEYIQDRCGGIYIG